ncbi:phosphoribosylglycinamide formyltransferase-1 [Kineococcus radiotolerans]|uniref:Phosphoribosylglycinamide formyltransferase n=2 Tax=Kineococcus radiotolerans TaxID=131568 RepID=A6WF70_KINRD|nr:phosphoribosylglycinamide formyltransferase [Kineococcus radiotolerans]ABS05459.1 phosphoribosylglycinamide formyltransferase [Kineococcus radiotolerans SRS30216 = ATCC BAA-149]MBB2902336.1 phosphoribosylglycinamide formyltransferase-1 [Kineococcus radiotolerans]
MPARVVVLASGSGSTLQALLDAADPAWRVVAVGSDKPAVTALDRAAAAGVETFTVSPRDFADRPAWDTALAAEIARREPDLVVLAGFMRILGAPVVEAFGGRLVNTHPALLPSFPGAHGVRDALAHGVKVTGCTVHLVDAGVDTGPILDQVAVRVLDDDDEATLHERIKTHERALLVDVVGRLARSLPTPTPERTAPR